jgi:hypothetical protein
LVFNQLFKFFQACCFINSVTLNATGFAIITLLRDSPVRHTYLNNAPKKFVNSFEKEALKTLSLRFKLVQKTQLLVKIYKKKQQFPIACHSNTLYQVMDHRVEGVLDGGSGGVWAQLHLSGLGMKKLGAQELLSLVLLVIQHRQQELVVESRHGGSNTKKFDLI